MSILLYFSGQMIDDSWIMIHVHFMLHYQSQLRRTRKTLLSDLDACFSSAVKSSGGTYWKEHNGSRADFDDGSIAFWLGLSTFLEHILSAVEQAASELYGYACILRSDSVPLVPLRPFLHQSHSGIWCDERIRGYLDGYADFDPKVSFGACTRLLSIRPIRQDGPVHGFSFLINNKLITNSELRMGMCSCVVEEDDFHRNFLLHSLVPSGTGKEAPAIIRFGLGGTGFSCIMDALKPRAEPGTEGQDEEKRWADLSKAIDAYVLNRLRDELPVRLFEHAPELLGRLIDGYKAFCASCGTVPHIIIMDIHKAETNTIKIFMEIIGPALAAQEIRLWMFSKDKDTPGQLQDMSVRTFMGKDLLPGSDSSNPMLPDYSAVPIDLWELAYTYVLMAPFFPEASLGLQLTESGMNPKTLEKGLAMLKARALLFPELGIFAGASDFIHRAEEALGNRSEILKAFVCRRILDHIARGLLTNCFAVLRGIASLGGDGGDDVVLGAIMQELIDGTVSTIREALSDGSFKAIVGPVRAPSLEYLVRTFEALYRGDEQSIRESCTLEPPLGGNILRYDSYEMLNRAAYRLSTGAVPAASADIKGVILRLQGTETAGGLARAYRLFALVDLSQGHLSDAIDYLTFSMEAAENKKEDFEAILVYLHAASAYFLYGNISKADRLALRAEKSANDCGLRQWIAYARFFQGRMHFEAGRYLEAQKMFESIMEVGSEAHLSTLKAWTCRARVFADPSYAWDPAERNGDAELFQLEYLVHRGQYAKAALFADSIQGSDLQPHFIYTDQPDWSSGFSQCEYLTNEGKVLQSRLIAVYRALALSRCDRDLVPSVEVDSAVVALRSLVRDGKISELDPNDAFYIFAYYKVLETNGASEIDRETVLSLSFKRLQRRASRIDDMETKRAYLNMHFWNSSLGVDAKKHNLI